MRKIKRTISKLGILLAAASLIGCAKPCTQVDCDDPFGGINRGIYGINRGLDKMIIIPVVRLYDALIPKPMRSGISNFYANIREIPTFPNDVLQGRFVDARQTAARFIINSTLGLAGLFDVASIAGLERRQNDFGITLARWGWKDSTYIVLPILGPSTIRDGIGLVATYYTSVYPYIHSKPLRWSMLAVNYVDLRSDLLQAEPVLEEAVINGYSFLKTAYIQHRQFEISGESESLAESPDGESSDKTENAENKDSTNSKTSESASTTSTSTKEAASPGDLSGPPP